MIAACPRCSARYRVQRERLAGEGVRLRCARCQSVFRVRASPAQAENAPAPEAQPPAFAEARQPDSGSPPTPDAPRSVAAPAPAEQPSAAPTGFADPQQPSAAPTGPADLQQPSAAPTGSAEAERPSAFLGFGAHDGVQACLNLLRSRYRAEVFRDGGQLLLEVHRQRPGLVVLGDGLARLHGAEITELIKRDPSMGDVMVIWAGPPCDAFTPGHEPDRQIDDRDLVRELSRLLEIPSEGPAPGADPGTSLPIEGSPERPLGGEFGVGFPPDGSSGAPRSGNDTTPFLELDEPAFEDTPQPGAQSEPPGGQGVPPVPGPAFKPPLVPQSVQPVAADSFSIPPNPEPDSFVTPPREAADSFAPPPPRAGGSLESFEAALGEPSASQGPADGSDSFAKSALPLESAEFNTGLEDGFTSPSPVEKPLEEFVSQTPPPPPAPPAESTPRPGEDPLLEAKRAEAMRLARIVISDIVLYNESKFAEALRGGNVLETMGGELEEGRELFRSRVDPRISEERDYLADELRRVATARQGQG